MMEKVKLNMLDDLHDTLHRIDNQISELENRSNIMGINATLMRDTTGGYMLTPLLIAKAQVIHSIILLSKEE